MVGNTAETKVWILLESMMNKIFLDTNFFVYLIDQDAPSKNLIATNLLHSRELTTSTQVLAELVNVCKRRFKYSKVELCELIDSLFEKLEIFPTTQNDFIVAHRLIAKHQFQYFDAIIIATALNNNCTHLYTEDLQHGQKLENKLCFFNSFL